MIFINIKNLCSAKELVNRIKRQVADWEKYLQITYLRKEFDPEYIENLKNTMKEPRIYNGERIVSSVNGVGKTG